MSGQRTKPATMTRQVWEAVTAAEEALVDLGACDDPACREPNCVQALVKVRQALGSALPRTQEATNR